MLVIEPFDSYFDDDYDNNKYKYMSYNYVLISYVHENKKELIVRESMKNEYELWSINPNGDIYYTSKVGYVYNDGPAISNDSPVFIYNRINIFDSSRNKKIVIDFKILCAILDPKYDKATTSEYFGVLTNNNLLWFLCNNNYKLDICYDIDTDIVSRIKYKYKREDKPRYVYLDTFLTKESKQNNKILTLSHSKKDINIIYYK
jgi:hypothetical protein